MINPAAAIRYLFIVLSFFVKSQENRQAGIGVGSSLPECPVMPAVLASAATAFTLAAFVAFGFAFVRSFLCGLVRRFFGGGLGGFFLLFVQHGFSPCFKLPPRPCSYPSESSMAGTVIRMDHERSITQNRIKNLDIYQSPTGLIFLQKRTIFKMRGM